MTDTNLILVLVAAAVLAGLIAWWFRHGRGASPQVQRRAANSQAEKEFRTVFSMTSPAAKEAMIERWMRREGCDRSEAMRRAVEEWRRDNR
jgi:Flp pilus assembly protein CpaB